jgi:hypothetical protein
MTKRIAVTKNRIAILFLAMLIMALSPLAQAKTYLGSGGTPCGEYMRIK